MRRSAGTGRAPLSQVVVSFFPRQTLLYNEVVREVVVYIVLKNLRRNRNAVWKLCIGSGGRRRCVVVFPVPICSIYCPSTPLPAPPPGNRQISLSSCSRRHHTSQGASAA